jgi:hypothetical protein
MQRGHFWPKRTQNYTFLMDGEEEEEEIAKFRENVTTNPPYMF